MDENRVMINVEFVVVLECAFIDDFTELYSLMVAVYFFNFRSCQNIFFFSGQNFVFKNVRTSCQKQILGCIFYVLAVSQSNEYYCR